MADQGDKGYSVENASTLEAQIKQLKYNLDGWKEVVLQSRAVLIWERNWHPTALLGGSTILFTLLWLIDPSLLTTLSVLGLILNLCDYVVPMISSSIFKPEHWTNEKDNAYEQICTSLVLYKTRFLLALQNYYRLKSTNKRTWLVLTTAFLSILAWIGCTFNNLFLGYLFVNFLLLLPGMEYNGMLAKYKIYMHGFVNDYIRNAKPKKNE